MGQYTPYPQFVGGTYANRAFVAGDVERSINGYPSTVESGAGKNRKTWTRRPGRKLAVTCPTGPLQELFSVNNLTFAISGNHLYQITGSLSGGFSVINPLSGSNALPGPDTGAYYSMCANRSQILILPNDPDGTGWIYTYGTAPPTLAQIASAGFVTGSIGTFVDGYFVANQGTFGTPGAANNSFGVSNLNDGTTWQGINIQAVEDYPDQLVSVANFLHYLQLFGSRHSEAYYDTGSNSTIFARYEGSYQYIGLAAQRSVVYLDNSLFYLGQDDRGQIIVFRLDGFTPKRVSNYSFEQKVQTYANPNSGVRAAIGLSPTVFDAYAYSYQEDGHLWYVISFPFGDSADGTKNAGATWAYDVNENTWSERGAWVTDTSSPFQSHYAADLGRCHTFNFGVHFVGGGDGTGNVYLSSLDYADDNGKPLRWLRRAPHLYAENVRNFYHQFILNMQVGAANQGQDPLISLQYSQDGGQTWSAELQTTTGKVGEYKHRVVWDQLGFGRDYVFQVFGSDPTPSMVMSDAYLYLSQGIS